MQENKINSIKGSTTISRDRLIPHVALITASQAVGKTVIKGIAQCNNVYRTVKALKLMGVKITEDGGLYTVYGVGVGGLSTPKDVLNMGGSDISIHLLIGLISTYSFTSFFTGKIDLCSKPTTEIIKALSSMCVSFITNNSSPPIAVIGSDSTIPISYTLATLSAEIKSAILFAALNTAGTTTIIETKPINNYTEIILKWFGVNLTVTKDVNNVSNIISLSGREELLAQEDMLDLEEI